MASATPQINVVPKRMLTKPEAAHPWAPVKFPNGPMFRTSTTG